MPRKKLVRHFEPRYGVSREMLEVESKYVLREHEDYLLLSIDDLRKRLNALRSHWRDADEAAERLLYAVNERESLAWQCLIARDYFHMLELYSTCLRTAQGDSAEQSAAPAQRVEERTAPKQVDKVLPFSEWLFGQSK